MHFSAMISIGIDDECVLAGKLQIDAWMCRCASGGKAGHGKGAGMRKLFLTVAFLTLISCGSAFAAEKVPVMNAAGKVLEISGTSLKIERSVKGETEVMEFVLEKPLNAVAVGEHFKVSYRQTGMKNVLVRAQKAKKTVVRKSDKKGLEKVLESTAPGAASPVK